MKIDNFPRAQIRATLLGDHGIPVHEVDEITDLAIHAAQAANTALWDTCERASTGPARMCAAGIALSLAGPMFALLLERFEQWHTALGSTVIKSEISG